MISDNNLDAALNRIKNNATELVICSQEPTTYTEAHTTYALGSKTLTTASFTGPAAGDTSGRKLTVDAVTDGSIDASGTARYLALTDGSSELLFAVALDTERVIDSETVFTSPAFDIEIGE